MMKISLLPMLIETVKQLVIKAKITHLAAQKMKYISHCLQVLSVENFVCQ